MKNVNSNSKLTYSIDTNNYNYPQSKSDFAECTNARNPLKKHHKATIILLFQLLSILTLSLFTPNASAQIPNLQLKDTEGSIVSLKDLKGEKLVVFDFWSVHCKPCLKAMPHLEKIQNKLKDQGLIIIGVNVDGPRNSAKVKPLKDAMGITYTSLLDPNKNLMEALNVQVMPTLVVFNTKGKVVWFHEGFQLGDETQLENKLTKLLK